MAVRRQKERARGRKATDRKPKRTSSRSPKKAKTARPIYADRELGALTLHQEAARGDALHALSLMRTQGYSLTRAAEEVGQSRDTVKAWLGRTLGKRGRRYVARPTDRLVRVMAVLTPRGTQHVPIYDSRVASKLGAYHAAVREALHGNPAALKPFRGKSFRTGGKRGFPFITDLRVLGRLAQAGALPEYQIYGLRAA